jgi:glyoxylase-like metal-dependent hydrolase (beta-lactamase superfamily II)
VSPAVLLVGLAIVAIAAAAGYLYNNYLRLRPVLLAPGVTAILGGGGNSVVVDGGDAVVVIDPKFGLSAGALRRWVGRNTKGRVAVVVNTHYHYDHSQGNVRYPDARIIAFDSVKGFMLGEANDFNDPQWWKARAEFLPNEAVGSSGTMLDLGGHTLALAHPGPAHTRGDLYLYLPAEDVVVTGDLLFHTYYPFFNGSPAGCSIPGLIGALRRLAVEHPKARFVPGHGPLAGADDLVRFADYLEALQSGVAAALRDGASEAEAVKRVSGSLAEWGLTPLPSLLGFKLLISTAGNNARWAYRILSANREPRALG